MATTSDVAGDGGGQGKKEGTEMVLNLIQTLGSALTYPDDGNFVTNRKLWDRYASESSWDSKNKWVTDMAKGAQGKQHEDELEVEVLGDEWSPRRDLLEVVHDFILPYVNSNSKVVEIGCGGGRVAVQVAGKVREMTCMDISLNMLARCKNILEGVGLKVQKRTYPSKSNINITRKKVDGGCSGGGNSGGRGDGGGDGGGCGGDGVHGSCTDGNVRSDDVSAASVQKGRDEANRPEKDVVEDEAASAAAVKTVELVYLTEPIFPADLQGRCDFVYCFDVLVHVDLHLMASYFRQVAQLLKRGRHRESYAKTGETRAAAGGDCGGCNGGGGCNDGGGGGGGGGRAFISTSNLLSALGWERFSKQSKFTVGGFYFVSPEIVRKLLEEAGLHILRETYSTSKQGCIEGTGGGSGAGAGAGGGGGSGGGDDDGGGSSTGGHTEERTRTGYDVDDRSANVYYQRDYLVVVCRKEDHA